MCYSELGGDQTTVSKNDGSNCCYCFDEKAQICLQSLITFQNKSCLQKMGVMHIKHKNN